MDRGGRLVALTVVILVVTPVISGPLLPGVSLSKPANTITASGDGTAVVEIVSVPNDSITLERSDFGAGTYHLDAPPAVITVKEVTGNPRINYAIDIPGLNFTDIHAYHLGKSGPGTLELTLRPVEIDPDRISDSAYEATIAVWLVTDNNQYTAVHHERIRITVNP